MKMYEVGGCVRDELLGVPSKDIDFTVVIEDSDFNHTFMNRGEPRAFYVMRDNLAANGFEIFLETPEFLTVRARFPKADENLVYRAYHGAHRSGLTADFVLARKESNYTDGRRPDKVVPGTLEDDLARRDFTMNAVAKAPDGSLIDPFNGVEDIDHRIIKAVGNARERLAEDALRAVRALRFSITKGFTIDPQLAEAMESYVVLNSLENKISDERIQQELSKMFRFDTVNSLGMLNAFPKLTRSIFSGSVSLDATMKTKGFNKPKPENKPRLPVAHNNCNCTCHREPNVRHIAACCRERRSR